MDKRKVARFWSKVDKNGPVPPHLPHLGKCWEWTGFLNRLGYGRTTDPRRGKGYHMLTHRYAWLVAHGELPADRVLHKCDNRRCVRPDHLWEGSRADNNRDRAQKGRNASKKGRLNGQAKLSEDDVRRIRELARHKHYGYIVAISRQFGVGKTQLYRILRGTCWSHVPHRAQASTQAASSDVSPGSDVTRE